MSSAPEAPRGALRIGAVAGVPVYLERTWLVLAVLIAVLGYQSGAVRGPQTAVAYAAWLVVSIFVAVVGHESGHALAARALGFRVHRIVATLWGGHTAYDATGATPWRTALVALAGPAVNGVLALVGWVAAAVVGGVATSFAVAFAFLNVLLAVFNLLPGLPLDGGAAVQSLVWGVTGRRDRGLLVAGWCGRVVAVLVVLWVVGRPVLAGGLPDIVNLVVAVVMGWILWSGASAAIQRAPLERVIDTVRVGDAAQPVLVLPLDATVDQVRSQGQVVVCEDDTGRPTLLVPSEIPPETPPIASLRSVVLRIADGNVVEAEPGSGITPVLQAMGTSRYPVVVLTRGGRAWGVVTAAAIDAAAKRAGAHT